MRNPTDTLLPELPSRPGYEVTQESRFDDPDAKHLPSCPCADCRLAAAKANVHLEVVGAAYGVTSACGEFFGREAFGMVGAPLFSGTDGYGRPRPVTCVKCLTASRLRLVKVEQP